MNGGGSTIPRLTLEIRDSVKQLDHNGTKLPVSSYKRPNQIISETISNKKAKVTAIAPALVPIVLALVPNEIKVIIPAISDSIYTIHHNDMTLVSNQISKLDHEDQVIIPVLTKVKDCVSYSLSSKNECNMNTSSSSTSSLPQNTTRAPTIEVLTPTPASSDKEPASLPMFKVDNMPQEDTRALAIVNQPTLPNEDQVFIPVLIKAKDCISSSSSNINSKYNVNISSSNSSHQLLRLKPPNFKQRIIKKRNRKTLDTKIDIGDSSQTKILAFLTKTRSKSDQNSLSRISK